jgi:fumarylacetoacetate (FAA) hydrolase
MKLVTYVEQEGGVSSPVERLGVLVGDRILDVNSTLLRYAADHLSRLDGGEVPFGGMLELLRAGSAGMELLRETVEWGCNSEEAMASCIPVESATLIAPVPHPTSMRDGYAFRQHVEAARRNRGVEMIPEFDLFPVFYFTNHQAVTGPGAITVMPEHLNRLDFELEAAIVIGRQGRNIPVSEADDYIAGYMVMNDWSARALQMEEMKLSLGPAKGKDFATSIGPWLVTRDELAPRRVDGPNGERYDLAMSARVNGAEVSRGNLKDMTWTFAQLIQRASYGVTLYPGDVIGSGTVGTGCFLELNGSKITDNWWLKEGDEVECEIDLLGTLVNHVVLDTAEATI